MVICILQPEYLFVFRLLVLWLPAFSQPSAPLLCWRLELSELYSVDRRRHTTAATPTMATTVVTARVMRRLTW